MKVTFLGTGTSQGVPVVACQCSVCKSIDEKDKRLRSSILIEANGKTFLIDSGPDFRYQMLRTNIRKLDAILLTHAHRDHVAGLDDIRSFNYLTGSSMDIYAEKRVHKAIKKEFDYIFAAFKYPGIPKVNMHTIKNKTFEISSQGIVPVRCMHHKLPVFGFRFNDFAYITDANFISEDEKKKLTNLEVLVVNGLQKEEHISHFTLDQAVDIIKELKPKKGIISHISHKLGKHEDIQKELPESIFLAFDLQTIEL